MVCVFFHRELMRSILEKGEAWDGREMRGMKSASCSRKMTRGHGTLLCGCKNTLTEDILCRSPPSLLQYTFLWYIPSWTTWGSSGINCLLSCPAVSHDYRLGTQSLSQRPESLRALLFASVQLHKELFAISEPICWFIPKIQYLSSPHTVGTERTFQTPM